VIFIVVLMFGGMLSFVEKLGEELVFILFSEGAQSASFPVANPSYLPALLEPVSLANKLPNA
jgi:hypothetical protein